LKEREKELERLKLKKVQMKSFSLASAAFSALLFGLSGPSVLASFIVPSTPLSPGSEVAVGPTGASPGTLLGITGIVPYSFTTAAGTTSGTLLSAVFRNSSGTLDFYYQINNSAASATSIERETDVSFLNFGTAVAFRLDGGSIGGTGFVNGTMVPATADRDVPGAVIGFDFLPGARVLPGTSSAVLVISTDATQFQVGNSSVIDGGTQTVQSFGPAGVPFRSNSLPDGGSTWLLMTAGCAVLWGKRRLHSGCR
jgi:hypothetical protein